jgi:hypothetical protein
MTLYVYNSIFTWLGSSPKLPSMAASRFSYQLATHISIAVFMASGTLRTVRTVPSRVVNLHCAGHVQDRWPHCACWTGEQPRGRGSPVQKEEPKLVITKYGIKRPLIQPLHGRCTALARCIFAFNGCAANCV